jgi:dTDP-4-amino-4,6-dideoxygalactose transaminase
MKALSWDKYRGRLASYDIDVLGYNYRTTEVQSALGLVQLRKLKANNRKRRELVQAYRRALAGVPGISVPFSRFRGSPSWHIFPVLVEADRDGLMAGLKEAGIQTSVHYPPVHLFSLYRRRGGMKEGALPVTEDASRRELTLPLHPMMTERDVEAISAALISLVKK